MKRSIAIAVLAFLVLTSAQLIPTNLRITVLDELGNIVEGAVVTLYTSEDDYKKNENPAVDALTTDAKGRVTFKDLSGKKYWVNVEKGDKNNYGAGVEVVIEPGKLNKSNIIIE